MGSPSLMIILILVVWIIVLAPLMIGNNKPIRRSGDGYDETRVLHEGGTAPMAERRRPKLTAADIHRHSEDTDYEVVEATDAEEQVLIDDAPALRTLFRRPGAEDQAEHIDGEVIEHAEDEAEPAGAETADAETADAETAGGSTKVVASEPAGSTSVKVLAAEDDAEDDADDDRYELDESYAAPEDFGYADETGGVEKQSVPEADVEDVQADTDTNTAVIGEDVDTAEAAEAGDEDLAFAAARRGRGGFDPERDKKNTATRFQRRQRTLLALIAACVVTFVVAFVAGGWTWVLPAVSVGLTAWFMIALRRVVLQERALHARRLRQLRRARMGVAMSNHVEHPRDARLRAGSVVLDLDDESPDFDTLPSARYAPENDPGYDDYDDLGGYGTRAS